MQKPQRSNDLFIELHVPDLEKVKEFYGKLGFSLASEDKLGKELGYLVMRLKNTQLHFYGGDERIYEHDFFKRFPKDTPRGYGVEITISIDDIDSYYKKVEPLIKENLAEPLQMRSWGIKDFRIMDCFGYYIRFTEQMNWI